MGKIPKKIKELFYNPRTDSLAKVLRIIRETHREILRKTDLSKGTLPFDSGDSKFAIKHFTIPKEGLPEKSFPYLIASLFRGVPRWHSSNTMYNVAPPPIIPTVVTKAFTSLYNPNLVLDTASGESLLTEKKVIKAVAEYIGWDSEKAAGIFTFGGKATTMYGIKSGLKNCSPEALNNGVGGDVTVFSTKAGHPSHVSDAAWLGIGARNVFRLDTDAEGRVSLSEMRNVLCEKIKSGRKIAAIIISGGTTNNIIVDPIRETAELRDQIVDELCLEYRPHIHVDAVVGFPWIFFKNYNFQLNNLGLSSQASSRIKRVVEDLRYLDFADSFGIDFHKLGFCPYISSLFMIKNRTLFDVVPANYPERGQDSPFLYTMENSRPGDGPNSAYVALNVLGERGFQILIGHITETAIDLQKRLARTDCFDIINKKGLGSSVIFAPKLPAEVRFASPEEEITIRNSYITHFIDETHKLGNPFYIDKIPGNATGANPYPFTALKAFIMSPYSTTASNSRFVNFVTQLKDRVDSNFDFSGRTLLNKSEFPHPLK